MHGTGRDAGAAHDAGIDVVKLRILRKDRQLRRRAIAFLRLARRGKPWMHIPNLLPERRHIHDQVLDHRQVAERGDA